jgi:hypothetical protein
MRLALSNGPNWVSLSCPIHLRAETDSVSETLWSFVFYIPDDGLESKISPIALYNKHHRQNPFKSTRYHTVYINMHYVTLYFKNKKFWEELIACFPWRDSNRIENDASKNSSIVACVFVAAVKFLLSRCPQMLGGLLPSRCLVARGGTHLYTKSDGRDSWSKPLTWAKVPWYTYQVSSRLVQPFKCW